MIGAEVGSGCVSHECVFARGGRGDLGGAPGIRSHAGTVLSFAIKRESVLAGHGLSILWRWGVEETAERGS